MVLQALDEVKDFGEHVLTISWHKDGSESDNADADVQQTDAEQPSGDGTQDAAEREDAEIDELTADADLGEDFDGELDFSEATELGKCTSTSTSTRMRTGILMDVCS